MDDLDSLKTEIAELKKENESLKASAVQSKEQHDYNESQDRFKTVFECSRLGNKIISSDLVIIQVNPAMVEMLGYDRKEEIIGTQITDYTPQEFQNQWKVLQDNLWKKASPSFTLETCLQRKDGSIIYCQVTSILFQDKGETLGYTIIEDTTEQQILRKQKEDFISVASHELKTPVASLRASIQLLKRILENGNKVTDKVLELSKKAEISSVKLGNLVINLLDATKIEQGQLSLNKTPFKISGLIDQCCNHIRLDNKYHISLTGDLSIEVYADEEKIEQVIINLVNNAVKYAPASIDILIHIERLKEHIKISVSDKGPGISAQILSKLFDRYFRVNENGGHSSGLGLGLGLYISSEIVRRHKGEIGVESEPGQGSTFWFTIPVQTPIPQINAAF
ncbi:PAS domain-containing sensor histidine kinase [Pedobacter sp. P351]|uniref:PAS domain-containing sensor histidine kinase n=1 Tax=Pedobacter superstes TaxID=3133441 RepID=UPI0030B57337